MKKRLYLIVRSDIAPGLQAAQACHAATQFCLDHPDSAQDWKEEENLILLSLPSKEKLAELLQRLQRGGHVVSFFAEPDLGGELTAVATRESATRLLSCLPLALRCRHEELPEFLHAS
jgi:peptidyl-tRNA hydrolase